MNVCEQAARDPHAMARREASRLAMAEALAGARAAVTVSRAKAGTGGGLMGLAVTAIVWPFAHMKMK